MKLIENRIADEDTHQELLRAEPHGKLCRGKLCGELLLFWPEAEDSDNVAAYRFRVADIVDDWINSNVGGGTRQFHGADKNKAKMLIKDLESMIQRIRDAMPGD